MPTLAAPVPAPVAPPATRTTALVAGTLAVALMLAGTRWGSYIGMNGLYLTDVLVAGAVIHHVLNLSGQKRIDPTGYMPRTTPGPLYVLFFTYVAVRLAASFDQFGSAWLRDAVPFVYIGLGLLSASAIARSSERTRVLTMRVLWIALLFHLAWTTAVLTLGVINPASMPRFPGAEVTIGTIRPDIDCAVLGITAALLIRKIIRREHTLVSAGLLVLSLLAISGNGTRGGFAAVGVAIALAFILIFFAASARSFKRPAVVFCVVATIIGASAYLPTTEAGQRLIATINPSAATDHRAAAQAQGTARARDLSWDMVTDWTNETPTRRIFGAGAGPDFISESGARNILQGTQYTGVRSPHNWFIGLYARMGLVGLILAVLVLIATVRSIWVHRARIGREELLFTSAITFAAILPIAAVGVVLESPFGAVPFWWSVGILLALGGTRVASKR